MQFLACFITLKCRFYQAWDYAKFAKAIINSKKKFRKICLSGI